MKARLTDPKCMCLTWGKTIFDNPFTRLKYIICSPLLSLEKFLEITLARITPQIGGKCERHRKNLNDWKCPSNTGGHKWKFSIIKGAQTKLGKNPKDPKILRKKKKKTQWCSKSNEENKNKEKEPKPNTRGHDRSFWKEIQMTKGQETNTSDP